MDIGRLMGQLVTIGLILASLGTLAEVTNALKKQGVADHQKGMISLGSFNQHLMQGR